MTKTNTFFIVLFICSLLVGYKIVYPNVSYKIPLHITNPINKYQAVEAYIVYKWNTEPYLAKKVVQEAKIHSNPDFPRKEDILAIIAIESGFKTAAVSTANAKGLMQILYKPSTFDINQNIADGTFLLRDYYKKLNSVNATIQSYNVGINAYKKGTRNLDYLSKYYEERENFKSLLQGTK